MVTEDAVAIMYAMLRILKQKEKGPICHCSQYLGTETDPDGLLPVFKIFLV
jgi:hypothetical protein